MKSQKVKSDCRIVYNTNNHHHTDAYIIVVEGED